MNPVPMTRFRPNLVLAGVLPWIEDAMTGGRVRVGDVTFRLRRAGDRCVVTTIDQETGERTGQPLRMLGQRRRTPLGLLFGTNLVPDADGYGWTGRVRVGDHAELVDGP